MRRIDLTTLVSLLIAVWSAGCAKPTPLVFEGEAAPDCDAWPETPVAVLVQHDPWAMVLGADPAGVQVFDDGTVIFRRDTPVGVAFETAHLTQSEFEALIEETGPSEAFLSLRAEYSLRPNVTDLPTVDLILADAKNWKKVSVYGYFLGKRELPGYSVFPWKVKADPLPREFDRVCQLLEGLEIRTCVAWKPRFLEVMIWPYEHSPEEPLAWPIGWPDLDDYLTTSRGDSYSLILPGQEEASLRELLSERREKQAVMLCGRKWSIAYRPVMPGSRLAKLVQTRTAKMKNAA